MPHRSFPTTTAPSTPQPEEERPLESLAGRGQTEGTPMGLGQGLGWTILALAGAVVLLILGTYVVSLFR